VSKGQVRVTGALVLAAAFALLGANPALAQLKSVQGILRGVVRDAAGTPQMGASVEVIPESAVAASWGRLRGGRFVLSEVPARGSSGEASVVSPGVTTFSSFGINSSSRWFSP